MVSNLVPRKTFTGGARIMEASQKADGQDIKRPFGVFLD